MISGMAVFQSVRRTAGDVLPCVTLARAGRTSAIDPAV
jgi:hypothetical protein